MGRFTNEYHIFKDSISYFLIKKYGVITAKIKIDPEDYEVCNGYLWILNSEGYVISSSGGGKERVRLHRVIMGLSSYKKDNRVIDHLNHNKHDNRKENLKICTLAENGKNKISKNSVFSENIYRKGRIYE